LKGDTTLLTISGEEVTPSAVSDAEIEATLPAPLQAGPQGLQVVHQRLMGTPEQPHPGIESNVVAFVLTPQITKTGGNYNVTKGAVTTETINGQTVHSVDVTVKVKPTVGKDQRVLLVLNQLTATDPRAYSFPVNPLTADTATLVFRVKRARPGTYLVRVKVDGAESSLDLVSDTYSKPDLGAAVTDLLQENQEALSRELERIAAALQAHADGRAVDSSEAWAHPPVLEALVGAFGLSPFERDVLLLCAGVDLEARFAELCASAAGDERTGDRPSALPSRACSIRTGARSRRPRRSASTGWSRSIRARVRSPAHCASPSVFSTT
jgi:hypothetical protein